MFLNKDELEQLTGKRRPKAQGRALDAMGIPYRRRPDGSPVVLRIHLDMSRGTDTPAKGGVCDATGATLEPVLEP